MAATVSGYKTSTLSPSPALPASTLNTIWQTAPENMTVAQLTFLKNALSTKAGGEDPSAVVGSFFA